MPHKDPEVRALYHDRYETARRGTRTEENHRRYVEKHEARKRQSRENYYKHREREMKRSHIYKQNHKREIMDWRLRYEYGLSLQQYQVMCEAQNHECLLCHQKPRKLFVDHDHMTGRVRGLLCNRCNVAVGYIEKTNLAVVLFYLNREKKMDVV